jgi:hypothetical protein
MKMTNSKNNKQVFSQKEKDIAISILNGMSIPKCSKKFHLNRIKCQTILNNFCMKSNPFLYEDLQSSPFYWAATTLLRKHSGKFIEDSKKLENVSIDSLIWALSDVPILTLNAIWNRKKHKIRTIKDLLEYSQRELLRFPCLGKVGLKKLISSLAQHGFTIREN